MTAFFTNTGRKSRISGNFPSYRRNDGYDSKKGERKVQQTVSVGHSGSVDAAADREMGADTGAVVWRRSRTIGATSTLASTVGKFLWPSVKKSPACSRLFWMNRLTLLLF
jgi:hypothetical protein